MSAAPGADYIGFDQFEDGVLRGLVHQVNGVPWHPQEVAKQLFRARGFKNYKLIKIDLRSMERSLAPEAAASASYIQMLHLSIADFGSNSHL